MILEKDTAFYANDEKPWHYEDTKDRITVTAEIPNVTRALELSGTDYEVVSTPVFVNGQEVEGYKANVVDNDVLGIVSDRYQICQNRDAFAFVDQILESDIAEVKIETAGSLFNRRKVWILARLPDRLILGEVIEAYLFFTNGHDGKSAITVGLTNRRIACNNMLQMTLRDARRMWTTRHMGDLDAKKHEAARTLGLAATYLDIMKETAEQWQQKQFNKEALAQFVEMLFPIEDDASDLQEKRVFTFRNNFIDLYNEKPDIENFRGTAWGAYLALTDYVSHVQPVRMTKTFKENRWASFMDGNKMMEAGQKAIELLTA